MIRLANIELVVATLAASLSALGVFHASGFPRTSAYLPTAVLSVMTLLLALWAFQAFLKLRRNQSEVLNIEKSGARRFLSLSFGSAILIALAPILGFITSFIIFIPFVGFILGYRRWKPLLVAGTVFSVLVYLIFRMLLERPLPPELFNQFF